MSPVSSDVSVVLCTFNRGERLRAALDALVAQRVSRSFEIIVVDNHSTDDTADVVREYCAAQPTLVRYEYEARQGLSHARNHGIAVARGEVIAFTDDDVRVERDWVERIATAFVAHPEVDYVGGRVLPRWITAPPRWLTTAHWAPLALQSYGETPFVSSRDRAICLVGANLAFRRSVFARVGTFTPELGRIKDGIGSTEDHDMQLRMWRLGLTGRYEPTLVAVADVTADRLRKAYHRRWHRGHGRYCAAMRLRELVPADMGPMSEPDDLVLLFGSPGFVYGDIVYFAKRWLRALALREDAFFYANKLRHLMSYVEARFRAREQRDRRGIAAELAAFSRAYRRKRRALAARLRTSAT